MKKDDKIEMTSAAGIEPASPFPAHYSNAAHHFGLM